MLLRNIVKQLGIGDEATVVIPVTVGFPVELVFVVFVLFKGGAQVDDFDPGVCDRFRDLFKAAGTLLRTAGMVSGYVVAGDGTIIDIISLSGRSLFSFSERDFRRFVNALSWLSLYVLFLR